MATYTLNNFNFSFAVRKAPKSGPTSSDKWNDTVEEIAKDLSNIAQEWNLKLVPIIAGLPAGDLPVSNPDSAINAFVNGLDGKNLWVDQDTVSTSDDLTFYNAVKARPNTVKEQFDDVYSTITAAVDAVQTTVTSTSGGLTTDQKNRIGSNIFSSTSVSSSTSLDGKSENNRLNILQIANDLYSGAGVALNNDGNAILVNSVKAMVDALLVLHNGSWSSDITLSHAGIVTIAQTDVQPATHPTGNDNYAGPNSNLLTDLDYIRTNIKTLRGTAAWTTTNTALYAGVGAPDSLEDLLTATAGTGTKTATNPWGYEMTNIPDVELMANAVMAFIGQGSHTDSTPNYSSNNYVVDATSLETAIGVLDAQEFATATTVAAHVTQLAALGTFVGQNSTSDSAPNYSTNNFVGDGDSLEQAIGTLDAALATISGLTHGASFLGLSDTPVSYAGQGGYAVTVDLGETGLTFTSISLNTDGNLEPQTVIASSVRTVCGATDVSIAATGCMMVGGGIYLTSVGGTRYKLTVDNAGALTTTAA